MTESNFQFLQTEWLELHAAASKAETLAFADPRTACFYARRALELAVHWLYRHDGALKLPYQDHLNALIHESSFRETVGPVLFPKVRLIKELGNLAVHSHKPIRQLDALTAVRELFHVCYWLGHTYAHTVAGRPPAGLAFEHSRLPQTSPVPAQTLAQLQKLSGQLAEKEAKLADLLTGQLALDEELARLRAEVAKTKQQNSQQADTHDYSEAQTRHYFIDLLLKEVGWALDQARDVEFPVMGMPNNTGEGFLDYVLWGDDSKPLALVEAKRTTRSPQAGQQQAKLYADCLERDYGQRPVIFYSNGYEHWLWDDASYPPRQVQGFLKKDELELVMQRRRIRKSLLEPPEGGTTNVNPAIVERYYQTRAIRRIAESFERDHQRKALVVMATGAGKTRTVIALVDLLMRCNWAKRVLFLADRVALVNQAVNAFKRHLPSSSPVNLVTEKNTAGRVYASTYPTMMSLIDEVSGKGDGQRRFGVGHFDLVIIDEAHRSVYQKYGAIFDYFDSLLMGLTATPKDEVDRNTYRLFELENGVPTDYYDLDNAVKDGFLVPMKAVSVPLKFQREGIRYDQLPEEEKEQWDALEWNEDGEVPDRVDADAVNKWLFNIDTVDKVLEHLMTRGQKVADGDRLGKTILFAKNQAHAEFIAERFNANYPHYKGHFARVITFKTEYAQSLIDDFAIPDKAPHIAISVDMLDTGIDVPEAVNLVFFKLVRSKTKFWQMIGRGTRLCPDLFGPGRHKEFFYVFDYCQNLEFFSQNPEATEGGIGESLGKRLFTTRLELIAALDQKLKNQVAEASEWNEAGLRRATADRLHSEVAAMNLDNFIVRPRRRLVETYADAEVWKNLNAEQIQEVADGLAGLPSELVDTDQDAKKFDMLMLRLQLAVLRAEPAFTSLRDGVREIAAALDEKASIPMVAEQMALILELQTDAFWENVTTPILENVRKRLRALVRFIEKAQRKTVYSDFEDELGEETAVELPGFGAGADFERFRAKARQFLKAHENHLTIHKLKLNQPLTPTDLDELERMLMEEGIGTPDDLERAKQEAEGLGLFVRSLVGLDRSAAKQAFADFLADKTPTANQIEFIDHIIDHLTQRGFMDAALLYESPFTDFNPLGVEGVFNESKVNRLVSILEEIRLMAVA